MLSIIFNNVLKLSIGGTLAALVILLVKAAAGKRLSTRWHYAVWFVLMIKLVMPITVPSSVSLFNLFKPINSISFNQQSSTAAYSNLGDAVVLPSGNSVNKGTINEEDVNRNIRGYAPAQKAVDWLRVASFLWITGVISMLAAILLSYWRIYKQIVKNTVPTSNVVQQLTQKCIFEAGVKGNITVRCVDNFKSPFIIGVFRPEIIIPATIIHNMDKKYLMPILMHEIIHIKGLDHIVKVFMLVTQSLHWFNPVIWFSFNQMMKDCETACDAAVINGYSEDMRKEYAKALVDMAQRQNKKDRFNLLIAFGESNLKKRVMDVIKHKKYSIAAVSIAVVLLAILSVTILTTGETHKEVITPPLTNSVEKTTSDITDVKYRVDNLLKDIMEKGPKTSSNPYDYIKDSKSFDELASIGDPALKYMFDSFAKSNEDGLKEYIMACACAKIMGNFDMQKGIGVESGRQWFYKYGEFGNEKDFPQLDADFDIFPLSTQKKGNVLLPENTNNKNMEDVISNYILAKNRGAYTWGEKAIESHKIYRIEEIEGILNVYIQIRFGWFGFENSTFTCVSGGGGQPVRIRLNKSADDVYSVIEYKQAMDGGMWEKSIRDMFPKDIAEGVIKGDKQLNEDLSNIQLTKAKKYLKEIKREDAPIMANIIREKLDDNTSHAIDLVTLMRNEFPNFKGTREILVRSGGPAPGIKIRCILGTDYIDTGSGQYIVTLTKTWDIKINGVQPISYWKYKIKGQNVELIELQDNDYRIRMIK